MHIYERASSGVTAERCFLREGRVNLGGGRTGREGEGRRERGAREGGTSGKPIERIRRAETSVGIGTVRIGNLIQLQRYKDCYFLCHAEAPHASNNTSK